MSRLYLPNTGTFLVLLDLNYKIFVTVQKMILLKNVAYERNAIYFIILSIKENMVII